MKIKTIFSYGLITLLTVPSFTSVSCWKMTTRPPLSPVASSSPEWLNSTVEMMSAAGRDECTTFVRFPSLHPNSYNTPAKNTLRSRNLTYDSLPTDLASKAGETLTDSTT